MRFYEELVALVSNIIIAAAAVSIAITIRKRN